jgi:hypothetical protein
MDLRRPRVSMGPEIGTAIRFVRTPTVETSSKVAATIGAVDTWAARGTEIRLEIARGGSSNGRSTVSSTSVFRGSRRSRMPKTVATESWKPVL